MKISHYLIAGVVLVALGGGLVYALTPKAITGDREADAACAALVSWIGTDKSAPDDEIAARLTGPARADMIVEITGHTEKSSIESIRIAGEQLSKSSADVGLFAPIGTMMGVLSVATACKAEGWTPEKAGIAVGGAR